MRTIQNSFIGGEISSNLFGRHDIEAYFHSAKEITNFEVVPQGGLRKRPGTEYLWSFDKEKLFPASYDPDRQVLREKAELDKYICAPFFYDRTRWAVVVAFTLKEKPFRQAFIDAQKGTDAYTAFMDSVNVRSAIEDRDTAELAELSRFYSEKEKAAEDALAEYNRFLKVYYENRSDDNYKAVKDAYNAIVPARTAISASPGYSAYCSARDSVWFTIVSPDGSCTEAYTPTVREYAAVPALLKGDGSVDGVYVSIARVVGYIRSSVDLFSRLRYKQIGDTLFWFGRGLSVFKVRLDFEVVGVFRGLRFRDWSLVDEGVQVPKPDKEALKFTYKLNGFRPVKSNLKDGDLTGQVQSTRRYGVVGVKEGKTSEPVQFDVQRGNGTWLNSKSELVENNEGACQFTLGWTPNATIEVSFVPDWGKYDSYHLCLLYAGSWGVLHTYHDKSESVCKLLDDNLTPGEVSPIMEPIKVGDESRFNIENVETWEQRVMFAGSAGKPFTIWFSRLGDVNNFYFSRPTNPDDAFEATLPVTVASRILHVLGTNHLILFTESSEYRVTSGSNAFEAASIQVARTSMVGSSPTAAPVATPSTVLFCGADNKTIYEMAYSLEQDNIVPTSRSVLSNHLTADSCIKRMIFQKYPINVLYCLLENGDIISMTHCPEQKVYAWSRMHFGGDQVRVVDILQTNAVIDDGKTDVTDVVVLVCEDKEGRVYLEKLRSHAIGVRPQPKIARCADHVGYPAGSGIEAVDIVARCVTVRPEQENFNSVGIYKNVSEVVMRMHRSGNVLVKPEVQNGELLPYEETMSGFASSEWQECYKGLKRYSEYEGLDSMTEFWGKDGVPDGLITKDVRLMPFAYQNTDGRMVIESRDGWPCEIQSLVFEIDVADYDGR